MKNIDDIDIEIIKILQEDCKTSYRIINKEIGISIGTIHNRIKKLNEERIITKNTILLDDSKLGYTITAIIKILIESTKITDILLELKSYSNICSIFQITGKYSGCIIAKFKDATELYFFINKLNTHPFIISLNSEIVLKEIKFSANV